MGKGADKRRAERRQKAAAEHARDVHELGDIKSTSGYGGLKMAGLRPPQPDRFKKHVPRAAAPKNPSIRALADELYRQDHG